MPTETESRVAKIDGFDWSELGRLVRVRTLAAVGMHFGELGVGDGEVPPRGTILQGDASER